MLAASLIACGPSPSSALDPPSEGDVCVPEATAALGPEAPLTVGQGSGSSFVALEDGDVATFVLGFQGGYMITPVLRLPLVGEQPSLCLEVVIAHQIVDGPTDDVSAGLFQYARFERGVDGFESAPVSDLLAYDPGLLEGRSLSLDVTVRGSEVTGSRSVVLLLTSAAVP